MERRERCINKLSLEGRSVRVSKMFLFDFVKHSISTIDFFSM